LAHFSAGIKRAGQEFRRAGREAGSGPPNQGKTRSALQSDGFVDHRNVFLIGPDYRHSSTMVQG